MWRRPSPRLAVSSSDEVLANAERAVRPLGGNQAALRGAVLHDRRDVEHPLDLFHEKRKGGLAGQHEQLEGIAAKARRLGLLGQKAERLAITVSRDRAEGADGSEVVLQVALAQMVGRQPQPIAAAVLQRLEELREAALQAVHQGGTVAPEIDHAIEDVDIPRLVEAVFRAGASPTGLPFRDRRSSACRSIRRSAASFPLPVAPRGSVSARRGLSALESTGTLSWNSSRLPKHGGNLLATLSSR